MPLKLVTGPANAAKAGEVLGALRARVAEDPILVVPAFRDVEHNQRELAARGAVFGVKVLRSDWLFREIARRAGYAARVASEVQRELIVEEAVRGAGLSELAESAGQPGFARAALEFVAELERSMVEPARLTKALRQWAGDGPRRAYADDVAAIYRRYRDGLEAAGLVDPELFAWRALDALRREPAGWGGTPLFAYGFDDFTPLELDAIETVAGRCEADVTVSLPFEPGRAAFKAVAPVQARLAELASDTVVLDPISDHYAGESRQALHHVERSLFEAEEPERLPAGDAVRLHAAGGERAEVELVAAEVLRLLRGGTPAGEVAVVFRRPARYASVVEQVFGAYGIPFSIDRMVPLRHTALGRALLALIRCAGPDASADDLLAWLRAPGHLREPGLADRLEAEVRKEGITSADGARAIWERDHWQLEQIDTLRGARGMPAFLEELDRRLGQLFAGPYRRQAPVLSGPQLDDARAYDAAHDALRELHAVVRADPKVQLNEKRVHDTLAELEVRVGENPQPDRVQVAAPGAIRARRFEAVFVCGLQEREFPAGSAPEPFLPDTDRREIAMASGLVLPMREEQLDRERYLFYVCASRAERQLVLSSRYCDEEGNPQAASFFVEDVRELFDGLDTRRRSLSDITWAPEEAPTAAEWERAVAARGPRMEEREAGRLTAPALLEALAAREAVSASSLEHFADCPVKWLVEDVLRPDALEPDSEQMVRGSYAHAVLEATYSELHRRTGTRSVTLDNLAEAERILLEELEGRRGEFRLSPQATRVRAAVRRLEFDLLRYLRHDAESDSAFEPEHLELEFGPVELAGGVRLRGKVDRVDVWDGHALVRDYKSGKSADRYKVASWEKENRFQAALYLLVVEEVLGLKPAGGVYVPLGGTERRPRGMVAAAVDEVGSDFYPNDRLDEHEFDAKLDWAREQIGHTAERMLGGELECTPDTCAWNGGCAYPSICRCEG